MSRSSTRRAPGRGYWKKKHKEVCPVTGKRRYRDQRSASEALAGIRFVRAAGDFRRREVRSYQCDWCGGWHVTSQELRFEEEQR